MKVEDFEYWAKFYFERYGFKCTPMCGKNEIFTTHDMKFENDSFSFPSNTLSTKIPVDAIKKNDWLEQACKIARDFSDRLTGIAVLTCSSNVVGIDFDNITYFNFWKQTFKIKSPIVKTGKGYHTYFYCKDRMMKSLVTEYYDIQGWMHMMLPPSLYYVRNKTKDTLKWIRKKDVLYKYEWISMIDIPKIDLLETGLIPKWFIESKEHKKFLKTKSKKLIGFIDYFQILVFVF